MVDDTSASIRALLSTVADSCLFAISLSVGADGSLSAISPSIIKSLLSTIYPFVSAGSFLSIVSLSITGYL